MSEKILEVKNVSKMYGDRYALKNVDFEVYAGEIFGFIGPNGAGKSTLMRIISGLSSPTTGEVFICGKSVQRRFESAVINLGAMIEDCQVYGYMTGKQNLNYYAKLYKGIPKKRIDEVAELVGMTPRINDKVKTYSLGMRQRIALAQAILHQPKLLILDEPTNGLDVNGVMELRQTLRALAAKTNISILISSHVLNEMEQLCDTVAIVDKGSILEIRTLDELHEKNGSVQRLRIRVNYPNYAAKLIYLKYDVPVEKAGNSILVPFDPNNAQKIINSLEQRNIKIYGTKIETKSLEDIYIEILKKHKTGKIS